MKARKQISLEELFRLYPQLKRTILVEAGPNQGEAMPADVRLPALTEAAGVFPACTEA